MIKLLATTLLTLSTIYSFTQGLFDVSVVHKIEINFYHPDWDHKLDSLAALGVGTGSGTGRIPADVVIDGTAFDSCGVRYKGNSSMDPASNKNPFNIDLNYYIPGQEYQGKDKIKLANCFTDPSMVREALTYELANRYMDCPRASFVELYVNDEFRGIYTNTESVDNEFLRQHYGSEDNPFFKCDPISFELYGDNSNLAYHPDTMAYDTLYDMKSAYGLEELQELTYQLEFEPETLGDYFDIDRALWFLAISSAFVHNDGYTAFGHNYYVYKQDNGTWSIVLWDVNMSFGGLLWNGTNLLPLVIGDLQEQDPFLHESAYDFRPLMAQMLTVPEYRKMYVAHYRTIIEENISNGYYLDRAETMHNLIDPFVAVEPYSHYPYADFTDNLYDDVGFWVDLRPGLENLMTAREDYLTGLTEFQHTRPDIIEIVASPALPESYSTVNFTVDVDNADQVHFAYRHNEFDRFTIMEMFDDGLHGDGAADDGVFGIDVMLGATDLEYYVYAENPLAGRFSPARAAYEFYTLSPGKGLVINEIMADNETTVQDEAGDFDDWIELYNNTAETIDLNGYFISDDAGNPEKWSFPDVTIAAGEYLILWADSDTLAGELHTNFKLSAGGEILSLTDSDGQLVDQVDFAEQYDDITFGRYENGIGGFDYLYPTFAAENTMPVGIDEEVIESGFSIYPNPANESVFIALNADNATDISIYSMGGKRLISKQISGSDPVQIDVSTLPVGLYLVVDSYGNNQKLIIR